MPRVNVKPLNDTHPAEADEASLAQRRVQPKLSSVPTVSGGLLQSGELTQATVPGVQRSLHRSYQDEEEATRSAGPGAVAPRSQGADLTTLLQEQQTDFRQRYVLQS